MGEHKSGGEVLGLFFMALALGGCTSLAQPDWTEDITLRPGWDRVRRAAFDSVRSPLTWGPLVGAALLQVNDLDQRASDWAAEETPLFGSQDGASSFEHTARSLSEGLYLTSLVAAPSSTQPDEWMTAKLTGLGLVLAADSFRHHSVSTLKGATHRTRPTGTGEGFPSSYASGIALTSTLTHGNLRSTPLPDRVRLAGDVGLFMLAAAGSWARVESGEHYPSDVLVGMALGHVVASFLNDAFLHRPDPMHLGPQPPIPPPPAHAGRTRFTGGPRGTFGLGVYGEF